MTDQSAVRRHVFSGRNAPIPCPSYFPKRIGKVEGCSIWDRDSGERFVDLWMGFGSLLFGHADQRSAQLLSEIASCHGFVHTYCHEAEEELASRLASVIPSAKSCRFAVTGQEATSYAVRMARSLTGRDRIALVKGGYHGANDSTGFRSPAGIPSAASSLITLLPHNDSEALNEALGSGLYAAFMVEPVLGNNGVRMPSPGYLSAARDACSRSGTLLIFDEVMTGFRNNLGGAQKDFDVVPDLSTFGKALGGGLPISAICGSDRAMSALYPSGHVAQEGTFYGTPLAVRMACAAIDRYQEESTIAKVASLVARAVLPAREWIERAGVPVEIQTYGGMFSVAFGGIAREAEESSSNETYQVFLRSMWERKFLMPSLQSEAAFLCIEHERVLEELATALLESVEIATRQ